MRAGAWQNGNSRAKTVAVIEDDETILDAISLFLELEGWVVHTYLSGEAFLSDFAERQPNCIILDPHLPGTSGAEVARKISDAEPGVPIIGLTARPNSELTLQLVRLGVRVMLTKPVRAEELVTQIQAAIGNSA